MKILYFVSILCLLLTVDGKCPDSSIIEPCTCFNHDDNHRLPSLICENIGIDDLNKGKMRSSLSGEFSALIINSTTITEVDEDFFGNATFEAIIFVNNMMLTRINPKAFSKSAEAHTVNGLDIADSPQYSDSHQLFELVNYLKVKSLIRFSNIGIKEIPDYAFKTDLNLKLLLMENNKIQRIGKSAFAPLSHLNTIILSYNEISEIDSDGLTFNLSDNVTKGHLFVILNNNNLTENSFHEHWTNSKPGYRSIIFEMNSNKIEKLPQKVFGGVLSSVSTEQLSFENNRFVCDCNMKYLLESKIKYDSKLIGVHCANQSDKHLFILEIKDLGNC